MRAALLFAVLSVNLQAAEVRDLRMPIEGGGDLFYGLLVPDGYKQGDARPLVLALHPGGERTRYYGSAYARMIVAPAVEHLRAIVVAPDCPAQGWNDPDAERAVMALLDQIGRQYSIDRRRVLVTGFSMGGRGTWFMASRHRDLFTAAIPIAASVGDLPVDSLATMPTYVIHSRRDQVVPFAPAEQNARALEQQGRRIRFEALTEPTHFDMGAYLPALRRAVDWVSVRW